MHNVPLSFAAIRPWRGSLDRAFEELAFQLLKDEVPVGTLAIRAGTPDGGVEWYANFPDGSQWGWQAKNILDIDVLLRAMTESVQAVIAERPHLVRLTFVIPWNLAPGTLKGKRKSQRQKYEDKIAAWKRDYPGADRIAFKLVQESDLLAKLALPKHRGRAWFWWQRPSLGLDWLETFHQQQATVAGDKYRPDLQVDLPISKDLAGLGLSQSIVDEFALLRKRLRKAIQHLGSLEFPDPEIVAIWQAIVDAAQEIIFPLGTDDPFSQALQRFEVLETALNHCLPLVRSLESLCFRRRDPTELEDEARVPDRDIRDRLNSIIYDCRSLRQPASALLDWLQESATLAARSRLYFLVGPAGSGKTHLLLDSSRQALTERRPAVVLHGAHFGGEIWTSICGQLGLAHLGKDVLLGAMDSAAEAAGIDGRRFVIMIDALNETSSEGYWEVHLPVLRAAIAPWPHLALAVSCRDTYVEIVAPSQERDKFTTATHPGFAGRETEATQKYFSHYGLEAPRIPLLTPEFSVPLFLRLYCESLVDSGGAAVAVGHESRVKIFERYLNSKLDRVARQVFLNPVSNLALEHNRRRTRAALDALPDGMARADAEWLPLDDAEAMVAIVLGGNREQSVAVISAFENEGVLSQEPMYLQKQGDGISVRVRFQAFSDFLLLKRRMALTTDPLNDGAFKIWLRDNASWGILEAATVVFPERYGIELPDFLGFEDSHLAWRMEESLEGRKRINRARYVFQYVAENLPYRSSKAVTDRSVQLLNIALRSEDVNIDLFAILYTIAPQPDNILNAAGMHHYLAKQAMPKRDATFGFAVYHRLSEVTSPIARLARWAAQGPYPSYPPIVIELAAAALMWLLSSPNRYMRDWVTKALVQLLHGHLDVMRNLTERFWSVNDPYIVQRVIVIAYGALMRGGEAEPASAKDIAVWVRENVFTRPIRPDEIVLDAARGIIEWAVAHDCLFPADLAAAKRRYGLKLLGNSPSQSQIEDQYGIDKDLPDDQSYRTLYSSLFGTGDFGRYVVGSDLHQFSRYRLGQTIPKIPSQEPRFIPSRWRKFVQSLTEVQQAALDEAISRQREGLSLLLGIEEDSPLNTISEEQWTLMQSAWTSPPRRSDHRFPGSRANRWIFAKVLSLGWSPKLFGQRDRYIAYGDTGRSEHKPERWGKKYQWIAYYELLARVADNYQTWDWSGASEPYDGLQEFIGGRDIDPSLPPVEYSDFVERKEGGASTWKSSPVAVPASNFPRLTFARYHGDITLLLRDVKSRPLPETSAIHVDANGGEWLVLDSFEIQSERPGEWETRKLDQAAFLHAFFVHRQSAHEDAQRLAAIWKDDWHELNAHGHVNCCFAGEIAWSPSLCPYRMSDWRTIGESGNEVEVIDATENYRWEGNILDCSIEESVSATMPSRFVFQHADLAMSTDGPSWTDSSGAVVAVYHEAPKMHEEHANTLYVRTSWLRQFLSNHDLAVAIVCRYERRLADAERTYLHPYETVWSAAVYQEDGTFTVTGLSLIQTGPDRNEDS